MTRKRTKKKTFSAVKAVKANARERVGQPKPERVIADKPRVERRQAKHKPTLSEMLSEEQGKGIS
ncbi:MAG TPA: hypothetical protein VGT04_07155 [Acidobacteriaceae bacterium]|nr:hypothetical protein [Acidobacteriaceae bacterium]